MVLITLITMLGVTGTVTPDVAQHILTTRLQAPWHLFSSAQQPMLPSG